MPENSMHKCTNATHKKLITYGKNSFSYYNRLQAGDYENGNTYIFVYDRMTNAFANSRFKNKKCRLRVEIKQSESDFIIQ